MSEFDFSSISNATFNAVGARAIEACCVFPKSVDHKTITLFCPDESDFEMVHGPPLNFALDKQVRLVPIPRAILEDAISERLASIKELGRKAERHQTWFLIASICLFLASLVLPCFRMGEARSSYDFLLLLLGWAGSFSWYANPLLLFNWVEMRNRPAKSYAFWVSLASLGLALSFLFQTTVRSGGGLVKIDSLDWGYWIWLSSILVAVAGSVYHLVVFKDLKPHFEKK